MSKNRKHTHIYIYSYVCVVRIACTAATNEDDAARMYVRVCVCKNVKKLAKEITVPLPLPLVCLHVCKYVCMCVAEYRLVLGPTANCQDALVLARLLM